MSNPKPFIEFGEMLIRYIEFGTGIRSIVFLWLPKKLNNGKWAWLRRVEKSINMRKEYKGEGIAWVETIYEESKCKS